MTNYDKIKNMTLNEMARFIDNESGCSTCIFEQTKMCEPRNDMCRRGIEEWLEKDND